MIARAPRYVPILTGLFWLGISIGILSIWPTPDSLLFWIIRYVVFTIPCAVGFHCLKDGFFASDERIREMCHIGSKDGG